MSVTWQHRTRLLLKGRARAMMLMLDMDRLLLWVMAEDAVRAGVKGEQLAAMLMRIKLLRCKIHNRSIVVFYSNCGQNLNL